MEDDSLLDDNNLVRETLPPVTPSKKPIHRLSINLKTGSETASPNNENGSLLYIVRVVVRTLLLRLLYKASWAMSKEP